jgi:hypothetical protein
MPSYRCTVNEVGPVSDSSETPDLVVYINLTDTAGEFANTWFYAGNGIQKQLLDVGIAAITARNDVQVAATTPHSGNQPYTAISRIYGLRRQPPKAPAGFHQNRLWPEVSNPDLAILDCGWTDESGTENDYPDYFIVRYSGTRAGSANNVGESGSGLNIEPSQHRSYLANISLISGYTYDIYVAAFNSAGEAPSNIITLTVPSVTSTASLLATVAPLPYVGTNFGLLIRGYNFGANESVGVTVVWKVGNESSLHPLDPETANAIGYFERWFTADTVTGFCPILVPFGTPQPLQEFDVSATGYASNRTASITNIQFTCPNVP